MRVDEFKFSVKLNIETKWSLLIKIGKVLEPIDKLLELTRFSPRTPYFQRLIITIRDWELDDNLGFDAGNKLLQEFLNTLRETQEGEELRNAIQNLFNKTDCMVMARPGDYANHEDFERSRKRRTNWKLIFPLEITWS